jgi:hypothetical protein
MSAVILPGVLNLICLQNGNLLGSSFIFIDYLCNFQAENLKTAKIKLLTNENQKEGNDR